MPDIVHFFSDLSLSFRHQSALPTMRRRHVASQRFCDSRNVVARFGSQITAH
jgi:hypothetical protein